MRTAQRAHTCRYVCVVRHAPADAFRLAPRNLLRALVPRHVRSTVVRGLGIDAGPERACCKLLVPCCRPLLVALVLHVVVGVEQPLRCCTTVAPCSMLRSIVPELRPGQAHASVTAHRSHTPSNHAYRGHRLQAACAPGGPARRCGAVSGRCKILGRKVHSCSSLRSASCRRWRYRSGARGSASSAMR